MHRTSFIHADTPSPPNVGRVRYAAAAALFFLVAAVAGRGQDIVDGFTRGAGNTDVAITFLNESYDQFWVGDQEMDLPPPLGSISVNSLNIFAAHGITDNLDVVASLPWISASADGDGSGPPDRSGLQDGTIMLHWRPIHANLGGGTSLDFSTGLGVSGPLSDYVTNAPVAIGHGSTNVELRAIGMLRMESGPFVSLNLGYSRRDGEIPDATLTSVSAGYAGSDIFGKVWLAAQNSQGGSTIGDGVPFPSNRVNYTRIGITGAYSLTDWLGLSVGGWTTLDGRNIGKATGVGGGLIFRIHELERMLLGR